MTILAWVSVSGGPWNGDASANPETGAGGVDLTAVGVNALFPIISISGGGRQTANFGNAPFAYTVPTGYTAGWPGSGTGGFTAFDPAKLLGTGTLSNNNRTFAQTSSFGPTQVQVPDADGKTSGSYYFEVHYDAHGALSNFFGAGIGRKYPGLDYASFVNTLSPGDYAGADHDGGIFIGSNFPFAAPNQYHNYFGAFSVVLASSPPATWFSYEPNAVLRFAITFGFTPPVGNQITGVGDLWYGPTTEFVDLSASSNRRKFIGVDGSTQFLGDNGERPFSSQPPIFLHVPPGDPLPDHFATNYGNGGSFTIADGSLQLFAGSIPPCGRYTIEAPAPNTPQGSDPQIRLSVSDDGGRTFSLLTKWRSMGKIGEYRKRLRWLKMGMFRQREIRLEITDPVRRNIVGIYQDVSKGLDE